MTIEAPTRPRGPSTGEFVALIALTMALVGMSIDTMLPALPAIARELGARSGNDRQLVITIFFAGLAIGQLLFGPLSDNVGRKRALYVGIATYLIGATACLAATSFPMILAGRMLQGLGAAGPRIIAVAIVRDRFEGRGMARIMSFVMAIFILVPVLAPSIGQLVLLVASWRMIFAGLLGMALIALTWIAVRLPETLPVERRLPFSARAIGRAAAECVRNRATLGYTIASGLIYSAFLAYLATSQQIFQEQYGLGRLFPVAFGVLAVAVGVASLVNAALVVRFGMQRLASLALGTATALSIAVLVGGWLAGGHVPLVVFMVYMLIFLFCTGFTFGNLNALAMVPMGHIAGVASAVIGSLTSLLSIALGTPIGRAYDGTVIPLVAGFAALYGTALVVIRVVAPGSPATPAPPAS